MRRTHYDLILLRLTGWRNGKRTSPHKGSPSADPLESGSIPVPVSNCRRHGETSRHARFGLWWAEPSSSHGPCGCKSRCRHLYYQQ
jgi:hypothetical protein